MAACGSTDSGPGEVEASPAATPAQTAIPSPSEEASESVEATMTETSCFCLSSPESGSELPSSGLVSFKWEDKVGASKYQLQMELPNGNSEFYNTEPARLDKYMASLPLAGSYSWRVLAFDGGGNPICFSDQFTFGKAQYEAVP